MKVGNWKCEICEKDGKPTQKFTNLTNLNHHITGVHYGYSTKYKNTETFVCDLCGCTIMGKAKMEMHKLRVHSNYRPYVCSHCGKRWATKHDLARHEERGKGNCHLPEFQRVQQKPIKCPYCNYRTSTQEDLEVHVKARKETGECPRGKSKKRVEGDNMYRCEFCNQLYHYKESLSRHVRNTHVKTPGHTCETCGKVYKHNLDMQLHRAKAHGQVAGLPHACTLCPKRYLEQKNLRIHCREKHNCNVDGTPVDEDFNPNV